MLQNWLDHKNILVTGATSGIGHEIACQFDQEGANLVLVGRTEEKLEEMKQNFMGSTVVIPYDLLNLEDIETIFQTVKEKLGKLDGMVHCAGIAVNSVIKANEIEVIKRVMDINFLDEVQQYFGKSKVKY